jgi:flagellar biosynthesis protein FlhF
LQHKELAILYRVLTRTGLDERLLVHWLENVQTLLAQGEKQPHSLRQRAFRYLMNAITVLDPWESVPGRPRPRLWTLVGPTGVGKTTTISKLAAQQALVDKRRVGLISLDNQRLGAHDQLAAFSRISGLPFIVAHTRSDLVDAIQKMLDLELVLIDTPGRSPHSPSLGLELQQMLGGLPDLEHHLALSATVQESNLAAAIQGFSVLPITSYIITKVDESLDFSGVFNQVCHHRVPISYLTTGQRVPEDLELATRQRVTELLLRRCQGRPSGGRTRKKYDQIHPA